MEKDIGKIKKNDFTDIVIRVDDFGGRPGITIREYVRGERYTGFTKSGTRIPLEELPNFKDMVNSIKVEDFDFEPSKNSKLPSTPASQKQSKPSKKEIDEKSSSEGSEEGEEFY
ncbi:hypothetical protein J4447_03765 [Candidatus Pacearchaeota archaeon]|nr:hypothetical protein [Candidatus Pacearchaeota archaeon]